MRADFRRTEKKSLAQFVFKDNSYSMDDQQFRQLLNRFGFSWSGYRKVRKGVKKRLNRHMKALGCRNVAEYLVVLDSYEDVRHHCERLMTVSISRFFRDKEFWKTLETELLPSLIEKNRHKIRVWSAGCACGDEVYSFKIVWDRLQERLAFCPELEITATDMNPAYLDRARAGLYSSSSLKEVQKEIRAKYFKKRTGKKQFTIHPSLEKNIIWKIHHLLTRPPGSEFHIIFLRNSILTYYANHLKKQAFHNVMETLAPYGLLIIGSHETLPEDTMGLAGVPPHPYVFRKEIPEPCH
jgi:chemotaxis methyl-accepting protein methylase